MEAKELIIVIPAYEPDGLLVELIDKLNQYFTMHKMIVVDDGSVNKDAFLEIREKENVILLSHTKNRGKGAALKTALAYIKQEGGNPVVVTADSDGQHSPEDIYRVYQFYKKYNRGIVLGSRKFDVKVPLRSAFGNNATRFLLRLCNGVKLNDTQTGLRAFGMDVLPLLLEIPKDRYEFEMTMLVLARRRGIDIHEIAIETIYINDNKASHFRPVRDFLRICNVILKYTLPVWITLAIYVLSFIYLNVQFHGIDSVLSYAYISALIGAAIFALCINICLNGLDILYGNPYLLKNYKKRRYYVGGMFIIMILFVGLAYLLNLWWNNDYLAFAIGSLISLIIVILQLFFMARKSILHES